MELAAPASQAGTVAAPVLPAKTEPPLPDNAPQNNDYAANMASDAFGAQLFTGAFSRDSAAVFNPSHVIAVGDRIQLRIWNGYNVDTVLAVDAGGNITDDGTRQFLQAFFDQFAALAARFSGSATARAA